jgi:hypothetical protein
MKSEDIAWENRGRMRSRPRRQPGNLSERPYGTTEESLPHGE